MSDVAHNEWFFDGKGNAMLYRTQQGMIVRTRINQDDVISYDHETHVFHVERNFVAILSCFMSQNDFEAFKRFQTASYPNTIQQDDESDEE